MDTKTLTEIPGMSAVKAVEICTTEPTGYPADLALNWVRIEATLERAVWARVIDAPTTPLVTVTFTTEDVPEGWSGTDEEFETWFDNNAGQLESSLVTHGNEWIDTMAWNDGLLNED